MKTKLKLVLGFIGVSIMMIFWNFLIFPQISHSFTEFNFVMEQRGLNQIVPSYGEDLSESFLIEDIVRQNVISEEDDIMDIDLNIIGTNLATGEIIFVYSEIFFVNKFTHLHEDENMGYFSFPNNVKKQDYFVSIPFHGTPAQFVFQQTEKINDLEIYQFSCESKNNDLTSSFPQFSPHTVFIDYKCKVWIEPKTGRIVNYELYWDSYFVENGVRTFQAEMGGKQTTDSSIIILVETTKKQLELLFIYEIIFPLFLGIAASLIFVGIIILNEKIKSDILSQQKTTKLENEVAMEKARVKSERLTAVGTLASRIAHDMRNPLTTLKIAHENIREKSKLDNANQSQFDAVDRAIKRMAHQIDDVLGFIKEKPLVKTQTSILKIVKSSLSTITIPDEIDIHIAGNSTINCDAQQMESVISNLILNAVQSMETKGELNIRIKKQNEFVKIEFSDTGEGIPEDKLEEVFEPLYSTKTEGTGLGLASCKSIIESHGGKIYAKNNPNSGVTITIELP